MNTISPKFLGIVALSFLALFLVNKHGWKLDSLNIGFLQFSSPENTQPQSQPTHRSVESQTVQPHSRGETPDFESLKEQYIQREETSDEKARTIISAKFPWCTKCNHYHPILAAGCPTRPGIHNPCGTRHFPDEWCPVERRRIPPPDNL